MISTKIIYPFSATFIDYPDNYSYAVLIYFLGCSHNCIDCHNPEFKFLNHSNAVEMNIDLFHDKLLLFCDKNKTNKIVFTGGDPLFSNNREFIRLFLDRYSNIFDICIYTGYNIEQVKMFNIKGFKFIKVGNYEKDKSQQSFKNDDYLQLASINQEIYNENYILLTCNGVMNFK